MTILPNLSNFIQIILQLYSTILNIKFCHEIWCQFSIAEISISYVGTFDIYITQYYAGSTVYKHRGDILLGSLGAKGVLQRVPFLLYAYAPMRATSWLLRMREHVRGCRSMDWGYAAAASKRRVAPGKRMRGRLHDPASAHATSSPANSRDNLLPPRIESQTWLVAAFVSCFLE